METTTAINTPIKSTPNYTQFDKRINGYTPIEEPTEHQMNITNQLEHDPDNPGNAFIYHGTHSSNAPRIRKEGVEARIPGIVKQLERATTYHNHTYDLAISSAKSEMHNKMLAGRKIPEGNVYYGVKSSIPIKELHISVNGDIMVNRDIKPHEIAQISPPKIAWTPKKVPEWAKSQSKENETLISMETITVMEVLVKSETDMFGNPAPQVPNIDIPSDPKADRINALSVEHKQIYNNLISKQKANKLSPDETRHLKIFNGYKSGRHSHEQLKGYIGHHQEESHLPLFKDPPKVAPVPAVKVTPPTVAPVESPSSYSVKGSNGKDIEFGTHFAVPDNSSPTPEIKSVQAEQSAPETSDHTKKINAISQNTGIEFTKSKNSNSWYATDKDGRKIRISDHPSKFVEKQKQLDSITGREPHEPLDLDINHYSPDAAIHLINGTDPFANYKKGDKIIHSVPEIGETTYLNSDHKKGHVEVKTRDGREVKYYMPKFLGNDYTDMPNNLKKSQLAMFDEPKVAEVKANTPKVAPVKSAESFIKPEHELTSDNGTWRIKGDATATLKTHKWLKDNYKNRSIYTYGGLMNSDHPIVDKIKKLHGNDTEAIYDHYNKITGRDSGKETGVAENQTRMKMKDSAGLDIGDEHFKVPDLSKKAKIERDSYKSGSDLHRALNNNEVSPELHKWHKDYSYHDFHKDKVTGENYKRELFNNTKDNFGSVKATPEDNLRPKELESYNNYKEKYKTPNFTDEHKNRLEELTKKKDQKHHLSERFNPEDKATYDSIQEDKNKILDTIGKGNITGKEREEYDKTYKELSSKESDLLVSYKDKLGLGRESNRGLESGFSYSKDLSPEEQKEHEDLTANKDFAALHEKYNRPTEESPIERLHKYPMSSNLKNFKQDKIADTEKADPAQMEIQENEQPSVAPVKTDKPTAPKKEKKATIKPVDIESHFPTVGIQTPASLNKTLREYGHTPEHSEKEYKPGTMIDHNGTKYSVEKDGGNYLVAKNLTTGKNDTLTKGDIENYPTDQKLPEINKHSVEQAMGKHGAEGVTLEDLYNKMGFPDDIKGKDYIKKRLRVALLQLEHHHETGGYHEPIVERQAGKPHPKEQDPKEQGIVYRMAKSVYELAAQTVTYIRQNLNKSFMIELMPKEKTIYEKSLQSKDIFETLEEQQAREKILMSILDDIQSFTIKKSGIAWNQELNNLLDVGTDKLCKSAVRFDLLKSMDNGNFEKTLNAVMEEENNTLYKSNIKQNEDFTPGS